MAPLPDSFKAYMFQSGADRIRDAYRASVATMERAREDAHDLRAQYEASGEDDSEYNEDGNLIASTLHDLGHDADNAGLAVRVVREAFITSAFHYWERSARRWTGLTGRRDFFPLLVEKASKKYLVSERLKSLNVLNNYLKHGGDELAQALVDDPLSDYMIPLPFQRGDAPRHILRITHDHVEDAFKIVKASGPRG